MVWPVWLKGGVRVGMFFFSPPPRLSEGGVFWQKYLPMVIICRIMCIMDTIMDTVNLQAIVFIENAIVVRTDGCISHHLSPCEWLSISASCAGVAV